MLFPTLSNAEFMGPKRLNKDLSLSSRHTTTGNSPGDLFCLAGISLLPMSSEYSIESLESSPNRVHALRIESGKKFSLLLELGPKRRSKLACQRF